MTALAPSSKLLQGTWLCLPLALLLAGSQRPALAAPTEPPPAAAAPELVDLSRLVSPSDTVLDALLAGRTEEALAGLDRLEAESPQHADAWTVYRAEAHERSGESERALETLEGFEGRFPGSPWRAKARFHRAELARALGRHAEAEVILREEAEVLRGSERRVELGEELLSAAAELEAEANEAPSDERRDGLRARAHMLLVEATRLETHEAFERRTTRRLVELALSRNDWAEIRRRARELAELETAPSAGEAPSEGEFAESTSALEAALVAARATLMQGDARTARLALMDAEPEIAALDASPPTTAALRGVVLAFLGDAWLQERQPLFAIHAWTKLVQDLPQHREAGRAAIVRAQTLERLGRTDEALAAWGAVEALPAALEGPYAEEASEEEGLQQEGRPGQLLDGLTRALEATLGGAIGLPGAELPASQRFARMARGRLLARVGRHSEAIEVFESYVTDFPGAEDWNAAQEEIVTARYEEAASALERSLKSKLEPERADLAAAEAALLAFAGSYPLDRRAGEAQHRWALLPWVYAKDYLGESAPEERAKLLDTTVQRLQEVARRLTSTDTRLSGRSLFMAAELMQREQERPQDAIALYRRVKGPDAETAAIRLREMQDQLLRLRTPRLTRPGEPIAVEVDVRNVESVAVQAVRLDLPQYFQRHGEAGGIDRLDLDLIAPDVESEAAIEGYEPFANLTRTLEVPVGGESSEPGVFAVTVIAEGKRATTLVVRSALDLIVRRSDAEVFALVTELDEAGKARVLSGATVTISYEHEGKRETETLMTGAGGTASFKAPIGARFGDETHVLASHDGHVASTEVRGRASGRDVAFGPRAHLQTDRSAYRPGDVIRYRAVLRDAIKRDGATTWSVPQPRESETGGFRTELIAPTGVVVSTQRSDALSAFGTLAGTFDLDGSAPAGQWTVRTTSPSGLSASGALLVGEIEIPRTRLSVDAKASAVLRGETIEITAVAETAWGAPLEGATIVWTDPQGVQSRSVTSAEGRATLVHATTKALEGESLAFQAHLPEHGGLSGSTSVTVALSAIAVSVTTDRPVALAGETFNVRVAVTAVNQTAAAAEGARDVRLVGTRSFATRPGRFAEETFFDQTIALDDEGSAVVPLSLESGGSVRLRAVAKDHRGREVEGDCGLEVSGSDDAQRLRVLADATSILVGDRGVVRVVDRSDEGGLALMTVEASTVLEHRVIQLVPGVTELAFEADFVHVPDVQVSIAAIRGREFYSRGATFRVSRPLVVTVEAPAEARPGEDREIVIRTTDGLGQPVAAEVAVALVDEALLRAFPGRAKALSETFRLEGSRTPAFLSGASAGFRYEGITTKIDAAILDEGRRAEAQAELEEMRGRVGTALGALKDGEMESSLDADGLSFDVPADAPFAAVNSNSVLGIGGGAGGRMGGRMRKSSRPRARTPEVGFDEPTAYWKAAVETGADGVARLTVPMPALDATWQLDVAGVSEDHRFGEASASIAVRSPLVAVLDAPAYFQEGDEPALRAEITLESARPEATTVALELRVTGDAGEESEKDPRQTVQRASVTLPAGATRATHGFDALPAVTAGSGLTLELVARTAGTDPLTATDRRTPIVRPGGYLVTDTSAGRLTGEASLTLGLDGAEAGELRLIAGATEAEWLVHATLHAEDRYGWLGRGGRRPVSLARFESTLGEASLLHGVSVLLEEAGRSGGLRASATASLRARGAAAVGVLITRLNRDGGWSRNGGSWRGHTEERSDARTTARAIVALKLAQSVGLAVPPPILEGALGAAEAMLANAQTDEERAHLAWALAGSRDVDLIVGRLHRERAGLSQDALAGLALALAAGDQAPMARKVAELIRLDSQIDTKPGQRRSLPSRLESLALRVLGRAAAGVGVPGGPEKLRALLPWFDGAGCGAAVAASARAGALRSTSAGPAVLEVTVGAGGTPRVIELRPDDESGVRDEWLGALPAKSTGAEVRLKLISGSHVDYALFLDGFRSDPPARSEAFPVFFRPLELLSAAPRWRGRALDEGFDCVSSTRDQRWTAEIESLGHGEAARLVIPLPRVRRQEDLVAFSSGCEVEVPLPAGVLATIASAPDHANAAIVDGALHAYVRSRSAGGKIILDLIGTRPGTWHMPAPVVRSATDPALVSFGKESSLTVTKGAESERQAEPRPTPDELLARGRAAFEDEDMQAALAALTPLFDTWRSDLRPHALSEVARLLLFATLKANASGEAGESGVNDRDVVEWFEILKERDPALFISFDDTLRIAAAYRSIGEPMRASLLLKAVIDETLGEDLRIAAAFDAAEDWSRSNLMSAAIWRRYPDSPAAEDADFALANRLIERGMGESSGGEALPAEARSAVILAGIARLRRQVALSDPRGTVAKDAGLALVTTYAQLEEWSRAADRAEAFGAAFDDPIYRDSFRYSEAVALWSDGADDARDSEDREARAVSLLEGLAQEKLVMRDGSERWSPNRELALYILAQVYHARKDTERAMTLYERVDRSFADAAAALIELRSERLDLQEDVVRVRPGEAADVRFDHKGIDDVEVLVYPVDLLTLVLRERDLTRVTSVDLAGVAPTLEASVELERSVLRPAEGSIQVQLDRPGAYLAMLRGGDVHRSALLLATDLDLDVVLDGAGSVRAQAMRESSDSFAEGAAVRIIGEDAGGVRSLETDRRGVASASGVQGRVTVIARVSEAAAGSAAGDRAGLPEQHYAFFGSAAPASEAELAPQEDEAGQDTKYLSNVLNQAYSNTAVRAQRVEADVQRVRRGVQVQQGN